MGHLLSSAIKMSKPATATPIDGIWESATSCATASYSFSKNGSLIASGGGSASGSFTCVVGDVLVAQQISGVKGALCSGASASIQRNGVEVASAFVPGFNQVATATWTVTSGTTSVAMYAGAVA